MIQTISHNNTKYPAFQSTGNASRFAIPYALEFCKGAGYDIGYNREEWKLPGAIGIDKGEYNAFNLPEGEVDYIFSSHCLEHLPDWVAALDHWGARLRTGGVLFLYLPDYSQTYWRPWHNRKHLNILSPEYLKDYLTDRGYTNIFSSGIDLNNSFFVVAEKC